MAEVVALTMAGGPAFVDAVRRVWDAGDAFAPIDDRLPPAERAAVLAAVGPVAVIGDDGERRHLDPADYGRTAPPPPLEPGDAVVVVTSGTSGHPKAVIHTHEGVAASARAVHRALGVDEADDRWLACLPLAHIGGLAVVMRSLVTGVPVEVHPRFDAVAALDAARRGATLVSLVTRALTRIPAEAFRAVVIGGAAPPADRPANVIATYGSTETGSGVVYDRRPLDGVDLDVTPDGEIRVRGPMLFRAYRHDPAPFDADGWFRTGDMGRWGEDGLIEVDGRAGDVIVTGGEKVWPARIETFLAERADIDAAVLIGRPDPEWGHRVVAVVVPTDPAAPPTLAAVRDAVADRFGRWAAPKELEVRAELPRTALGKIQRHRLA
ncbi:MAG: class I adenylate-forming enzyme family protein [Acidimicrobiales bacterium]